MQKYQTVVSIDKEPAIAAPIYVSSEIYRRPAFGGNHPLQIIRHAAVTDLARALAGFIKGISVQVNLPLSVSYSSFMSEPTSRPCSTQTPKGE